MRRLVGTMAVAVFVAAGCGGGDDESDSATDSTAITEADGTTDGTTDGTDDETTGDETTGDDPADTTTDETTGDETTGDGTEPATITSFEDIPQECLDMTADFLREIEPLVSPIDWANATMADFESVAPAFEAEAAAFDTRSAEVCASIDLAAEGLAVMIDFAADEAPGTVGFLEFLDKLQRASLGAESTPEDGPAAFEDCAGAIVFVEGLLASNETITDVPLDDMLQVANIASVFMSCTPEQQAFFESPEVTAFFGE
jgi:hypothetical protein